MQIPLGAKYPQDQGTHLGRGARFVLPTHWAQCLTNDNAETFLHNPVIIQQLMHSKIIHQETSRAPKSVCPPRAQWFESSPDRLVGA